MPQHFNFKNLLKFDLSFEIWTKIRYLIFSFTCVFYVKGRGVLFSFLPFVKLSVLNCIYFANTFLSLRHTNVNNCYNPLKNNFEYTLSCVLFCLI